MLSLRPASLSIRLNRLAAIKSRLYSTSSPLITLTDLPSPSTGRIRILSLNRPSARNAISRQLLSELRGHIDAIAAEYTSDGHEIPPSRMYGENGGVDHKGPTRALILASDVPSTFCAGADLKERAGFSEAEYFISHEPLKLFLSN